MNSLRARIFALLIVAILTVVGLATLAASRALQPPSPERTIEPMAAQIHVLARLAEAAPEALLASGGRLQSEPAEGPVLERMSLFLGHALARTGRGLPVRVSEGPDGATLLASIDLGEAGWLITPVPDPAPPEGQWRILGIWLAVIILGTGAISFHAARRLVRPLDLLRHAAENIGFDARIEPVPEVGPAEVRATARALNHLSARLSTAMESRMRLVAAAGHDLRTPMTRMRLRAEFIEDDAEREKWLSDLEELDRIADSAIRLVREEAGEQPPEPLDLGRMIAEIVSELAETGLPIQAGRLAEAQVRAAPLALKRALRNLMANAATHGVPAGAGPARVSLRIEAGLAVTIIEDDGPGIPEALLSRVFEPFFRVDPARRQSVPGAGLGLAIAREIIERLGGSIAIGNRQPGGLRQQITLPLA